MKVSVPNKKVKNLSDLSVWVKEMNPEIIGITKNHPLTKIKGFSHWSEPKIEVWHNYKGIPVFYGELGQLEYGSI